MHSKHGMANMAFCALGPLWHAQEWISPAVLLPYKNKRRQNNSSLAFHQKGGKNVAE